MKCVRVEASSVYDVLIGGGLLEEAGKLIAECLDTRKAVVVTDDVVEARFGKALMRSLNSADFSASLFAFPAGESSKNLQTLNDILEFIGAHELHRSDLIVCLGGGVVGDVGGLAAALYARGTRFVQIPTTLLAAVDSSVGGKTAVNLGAGKNLAGAFAQPARVLCDTDILRDLPDELLRDGAAEIAKYGVLEAPELLDCLISGRLTVEMDDVVSRCVSIKRDYVAEDEFDRGKRQALNLGHTIGHAVEKCSNYALTHGQGVAIGLYAIARAAHALGISEEDTAPALGRALSACGLDVRCPYNKDELLSAMALDKKRRGDEITLVVPVKLGRCELLRVPVSALGEWLEAGGIL